VSEMQAPEIIEFPEPIAVQPQGGAALFAKMARVMGQLSRVPKAARNQHHGYNYASADDVYDAVRAALAAEKVAFLPKFVSYRQERLENSKNIRTWATFDFTFACGDTGATWTCRWEAEADDTQDKGLNKVATAALKYFLLKTFVISTGDTEDTDEGEPTPAQKAQPKKPERRLGTTEKPATPIATNGTRQAEIVSVQPETVATTEPEERVERAAEMLSEIMSRELFDAGYAVLVELNELKDDTTAVYIKNRVLGIIEAGAHNKKKGKAG
jgi:hypothetical protein